MTPNSPMLKITRFIHQHYLFILGIVIALITSFLIIYSINENTRLRSGLMDGEYQRNAILHNKSLETSLSVDDELTITPDIQNLIDNIKATDENINYITVAQFNGSAFEIIASTNFNDIKTINNSSDYLNSHKKQTIVSYKELKQVNSANGETQNRSVTVINPTTLLFEDGSRVEGLFITNLDITEPSNVATIYEENSKISGYFILILTTTVLLIFSFIVNNNSNEIKKLKYEIELKDQLVANAVHELGNPVSFIRGALAQINKNNKLVEKEKTLLERAIITGNYLSSYIEDLLVVSRLERGKITVYQRPMDIVEIINTVISENEMNAKNKGLSINFMNKLPEEQKIIADPDKIKEIIQNLLSNAIKYSYEGEIIVSIEMIKQKMIRVSVKDNGVGISEEDKKKLFKRFSRLDSTAGKEKGTGLGLYITKELVTLQGGEISVESIIGEGSTFSFTLPIKPKK